jgi:hypothetical protein
MRPSINEWWGVWGKYRLRSTENYFCHVYEIFQSFQWVGRNGKLRVGGYAILGTCGGPKKNQCDIRAKHKNFGKIICPEKIIVSLRKLRDVREKFLICAAKFSYVCRKVFDVRKIFSVCPEKKFW